MTSFQINNGLFFGFSLININDLKNRVEGKRDNLILEIMVFYKKISASYINNITDYELKKIIKNNKKLIETLNLPYIDFIIGSMTISNIILETKNIEEEEIENFISITSVYYDLYTDIIKETKDEKIKELYKNSFQQSDLIFDKIKELR